MPDDPIMQQQHPSSGSFDQAKRESADASYIAWQQCGEDSPGATATTWQEWTYESREATA